MQCSIIKWSFNVLLIVIFHFNLSCSYSIRNNPVTLDRTGPLIEGYYELTRPIENLAWRGPTNLGAIAGVSVDPAGKPVVFHRGDHEWDFRSFDQYFVYQEQNKGPILENTILTLDPNSGQVIDGWGNRTFYLPHGIHIDRFGNFWLTDVALHQVFKYDKNRVLQLVLGQQFQPGSDLRHFCQPTSVAIKSDGDIIVADGYCNQRLVVFDPHGNPKYSVGDATVPLRVPHSLTILSNQDICVADRENFRVVCLGVDFSKDPPYSFYHAALGRVYGVASYSDTIYIVNTMSSPDLSMRAFKINPRFPLSKMFWGPETGSFVQPHAIAIDSNGTSLYVTEIGPNKVWKFDITENQIEE